MWLWYLSAFNSCFACKNTPTCPGTEAAFGAEFADFVQGQLPCSESSEPLLKAKGRHLEICSGLQRTLCLQRCLGLRYSLPYIGASHRRARCLNQPQHEREESSTTCCTESTGNPGPRTGVEVPRLLRLLFLDPTSTDDSANCSKQVSSL